MFSTTLQHCTVYIFHLKDERAGHFSLPTNNIVSLSSFLKEVKKQATFNFGFGEGGIEGTQVVFPKQRPLVI